METVERIPACRFIQGNKPAIPDCCLDIYNKVRKQKGGTDHGICIIK